MSEFDVVRRLLIERGCPDDVVEGGLAGLASKWDAIVRSVEEGYPFGFDDYLNDMDLRDTLFAALAVAMPDEREQVEGRVEALDARMRAVTLPCPCLWGEEVEEDDGLDPGREWWYFVRPAKPNDELAGELAAWGFMDDNPHPDF
ncbi:MAG: hypothetical protein IT359_01870 [Gemmatimonadaceae bacterium]|nr:hypothetical protein [Gemmatimonadaceae bacterium]